MTKKITLCGSTKFKEEFEKVNLTLTLAGHIVYSCAAFGHSDSIKFTEKEKDLLDLVHLRKILESDAIFVIDVDKYIGKSTSREIEWTKLLNKPIYYLTRNIYNTGGDKYYLTGIA